MSEVNLKMMRKSGVNEQAYLSCNSPFSLCVSNDGSKGLICNCFNTFTNLASTIDEFLTSLFESLIKCFSKKSFGKLFFPISDCLHRFFYRLKFKGIGVFFDFNDSFNKHFMFFFFRNKKAYVVSYLLNPLCRKFGKHFMDIGYCNVLHKSNNNGYIE